MNHIPERLQFPQVQQPKLPVQTVAQQQYVIEANPDLAKLVANIVTINAKAITTESMQHTLMALLMVSSYFAPKLEQQPQLNIKTNNSEASRVAAEVLAKQCYSSYVTSDLNSAAIREVCRKYPFSTVITTFQTQPQRAMRHTGEPVNYGHRFVLYSSVLPYQHNSAASLCTLDNVTATVETLSEEYEAELNVSQANIRLYALKNQSKFAEIMEHAVLEKPEYMDDSFFMVWKPVLCLGKQISDECFSHMYELMVNSNPKKDQLPDDVVLLIGVKAITEWVTKHHHIEDAIASVTLVGMLKNLGEQWKTMHPKLLAEKMSNFGISSSQIQQLFIATTGYKVEELEKVFKQKLNLSDQLQYQRYAATQQLLNAA